MQMTPLSCSRCATALLLLTVVLPSNAFVVAPTRASSQLRMSATGDGSNRNSEPQSRRSMVQWVGKALATTAGASVAIQAIGVLPTLPAAAAVTGFPESARLLKGYQELTFLLENWDKETEKCQPGGECAKNPDVVRKYLGLRSTTDPLFQVEKILIKGERIAAEADLDVDAYIEAAEAFQSTQSLANSMAFTSTFGEYNPGGGKETIEKYLEESRKQVVECQKSLGTIVDILGLK